VLWQGVPVSGVFVHGAETNEQGIAFACAESGRSLGSIAARGPVSGIEGGWQWGGTLQVSLHKDEVNPRQIFYITMDNVYIHRINNFADNSSPDFNGDTHIFSWEPVPVPNIETYKVQVWQLRQSTNSLVWDTLAFEADLIQGTTQLVSDLPSGQCFDFWLGGYNASGQLIASQTTHGYCTSP
jgi:hypothetical protein